MTPTTPATNEKPWSPQQLAIFAWCAAAVGHLIVRARAGTGKTTTIIEALTRLPARCARILVCAFNADIAKELQVRLTDPRAEASTLHSLGFGFVRTNANVQVDRDRGFKLATTACGGPAAPKAMVTLVAKLAGLGKNIVPFAKTAAALEPLAEQFEITVPAEFQDAGWTIEGVCVAALAAMQAAAALKDNTVDFDDMLFVPVARGWIRGRFDVVVVDEAQDMNACQLLLAQGACKAGGSIVIVGDDRQAIYAFRGADAGALDRMKTELKATELGLTVTYRCPKAVVALAAQIVEDFTAADTAPAGTVSALDYKQLPTTAQAGDFILSRKNAPLAKTCLALLRLGKRAIVRGRDIGKGLVTLTRKLGGDRVSVTQFLGKLTVWEQREVARWTAADKPAMATEMADRAETLRALTEGVTSVRDLIGRIETLFADNDPVGAVICSSVHKAKGLEADRVFLLADTFYPGGRRSMEERNIHYVAITRSKNILVLVDGAEAK